VEGRGRPLAVLLTPGQAGDNPQLPGLLAAIRVPAGGVGRPRTRPEHVVADKAYSARATRTLLRRRGIRATIPEREDEKAHRRRRGRAGGRPPTFDPDRYRGRNLIERCVNRLKQYRALATRYAKRAELYRGLVVLAAILTWLT
jgi:transposase